MSGTFEQYFKRNNLVLKVFEFSSHINNSLNVVQNSNFQNYAKMLPKKASKKTENKSKVIDIFEVVKKFLILN
jgi:hypothetical protein